MLVGTKIIEVESTFAASLEDGDEVLGIASTGALRRIPKASRRVSTEAVSRATTAFAELQSCADSAVTRFFELAANRLEMSAVVGDIEDANARDVASATERGRSTTRLAFTPKMRDDMIAAFRMWRDVPFGRETLIGETRHDTWTVEQWKSPLGVIAFVFEGRPNVFADATGVLRTGNVVVFRIGSDALGTARALMSRVIEPSLKEAGLPDGCVVLVDSAEHAAGWALFSDSRVSLAVARGSGEAVAELGAIARQAGISVSLHGTGGAWIIAGEHVDSGRLRDVVTHSLDRKVCNTVNTVCLPRARARDLLDVIVDAAVTAADQRGCRPRIHVTQEVLDLSQRLSHALSETVSVRRHDGTHDEPMVSLTDMSRIGEEFEWEDNPEFNVVIVDSIDDAVRRFNELSPHFIVSIVSEDESEREHVWQHADAPFVGDGFTRWVDGQFALLRPELGLSNWQSGRLFGRGGVLSGDSAFTVRLRAHQHDSRLHR